MSLKNGIKWGLILFALWVGTAVQANNEVGNGGDVVVCRDGDQITSVELVDFYEARLMYEMEYDLGSEDLHYKEKIALALSRLSKLDPERERDYLVHAEEFEENARFLEGVELVDIPDTNLVYLPSGCEIAQIVVRIKPTLPEHSEYYVSKDLWDLLDEDNRAGLVLHEVIYREAAEAFEHTNSVLSRYFNAYITSNRLADFSVKRYFDYLRTIKFHTVGYQGLLIPLKESVEFYDEHRIKSAYSLRDAEVSVGENTFTLSSGQFTFHENGVIRESRSVKKQKVKVGTIEAYMRDAAVSFHDNGSISMMYACQVGLEICSFRVQGKDVSVRHITHFYPSGKIKQLYLNGAILLDTVVGPKVFGSNEYVDFDEAGLAIP